MHQTKKDGQWRFGMKCHMGMDAGSGLVHTIKVTAANERDVTVASKLIREDDEVVYGDSGYLGLQKRKEIQVDPHLAFIDYWINRRPKSLPRVSDRKIDWERYIERRKSSVRCKVEQCSVSSSGSSASRRFHIGDWQRIRAGFTLCSPVPIFMCWLLPCEAPARHNKGQSALFRGQTIGKGRFGMGFPPLCLLNLRPLCIE